MKLENWIDSKLSVDEFNKKYRNDNETFEEWLNRVTDNNQDIIDLILEKKFIFGGRTLANRGLQKQGDKVTYSNCYVIEPPKDNIESIYDTCGKIARTFSYGGGVGIDISNLRPKGAKVHNAAKTTTGAVSFMDTFSQVAGTIGQKGRRGALMISMDISHPDIEEFIDIKTDLERVTKANISVKVDKDFMRAVKNDMYYQCKFTLEDGTIISKNIKAKDLFMRLAKNNWNYAEPGILYWDNINNYNLMSDYINHGDFAYAGVNPCAEEPLPAFGACNLGAINLSEFVINPFTDEAYFDIENFKDVVHKAVYALNDVMLEGLSLHPLKEQRESVEKYAQIGIGIMGLADMFIKLGITYGDSKSLDVIDVIGSTLLSEAIISSNRYMHDRNKEPFEGYNNVRVRSTDIITNLITTLQELGQSDKAIEVINAINDGLFNTQLLTIAPTGTIAGLLGTSYGMEPNFAFKYTRKTESLHEEGDVYYDIETSIVNQYREATKTNSKDKLPDYFISTHELNPYSRIDVQAKLQEYIDASISSTLNLPESITVEQVANLYMYGYEKGLKGLTIYRNNCRRSGILSIESKKEENKEDLTPIQRAKSLLQFGDTIVVDDNVKGVKRKLTTGCGNLHCTFYFCPDSGELREVFLDKGAKGGCLSLLNTVSRLISLCARKGSPVEEIVDQLKSVHVCPSYRVATVTNKHTSPGSSCASAVANALLSAHEEFVAEYDIDDEDNDEIEIELKKTPKIELENLKEDDYFIECPSCKVKSALKTEGCISCQNCGYSKCN